MQIIVLINLPLISGSLIIGYQFLNFFILPFKGFNTKYFSFNS